MNRIKAAANSHANSDSTFMPPSISSSLCDCTTCTTSLHQAPNPPSLRGLPLSPSSRSFPGYFPRYQCPFRFPPSHFHFLPLFVLVVHLKIYLDVSLSLFPCACVRVCEQPLSLFFEKKVRGPGGEVKGKLKPKRVWRMGRMRDT